MDITATPRVWQDTIEALYREDADRLWRAVAGWAGDAETANEAVDEAYAQVLARGPAVRDPEAWVWRTAFRVVAGAEVRRAGAGLATPAGMHQDVLRPSIGIDPQMKMEGPAGPRRHTLERVAARGAQARGLASMDTETVVRAQGGDESAFAALAAVSAGRLRAVAMLTLRDHDLADEAIQRSNSSASGATCPVCAT